MESPARGRDDLFGFNDSVCISEGDASSPISGASDASVLSELSLLETMGSPTCKPTNRGARVIPASPWKGDARTVHIDLSEFPGAASFGFFLRGWEAPPAGRSRSSHDDEAAKRFGRRRNARMKVGISLSLCFAVVCAQRPVCAGRGFWRARAHLRAAGRRPYPGRQRHRTDIALCRLSRAIRSSPFHVCYCD
jgi:hypothetical protein